MWIRGLGFSFSPQEADKHLAEGWKLFGNIESPVEVTPWDFTIQAVGTDGRTDVQLSPGRPGDSSRGGVEVRVGKGR